jgi:hypothetical protein
MWDFLKQFFDYYTGELREIMSELKGETMKASEQLTMLTQAVHTASVAITQSCQTISDKLTLLTAQVANNDVGPAEIAAALQPPIDALTAVASALATLATGQAPPPDQPL